MAKRLVSYKHTFINSIGTFFSRLTGILKQTVVNRLFGADSDPYNASFKIVNNVRKFVGEGIITNSFIPVYKERIDKDPEQAELFANNILNIFLLATIVLTVLGALFAPLYFPLLMPGTPHDSVLTVGQMISQFGRIIRGGVVSDNYNIGLFILVLMMPFTIFISLYAIMMSILNSHGRFTSAAFAPMFFNIVFIVMPIFLQKRYGIYSNAIGVVAGSIVQVIAVWIELAAMKFRYRPYINFKDPLLRSFFRLFLPTALNMSVMLVLSFVNIAFTSYLPGGSYTALTGAFAIIQAPLGMFGTAIATVILPVLSGIDRKKEPALFYKGFNEGMFLLFWLTLPTTLFFVAFPDVIVNLSNRDLMLLFTGSTGRFTPQLSSAMNLATAYFSIGLIPMSVNIVLAKVFYSVSDAKTPLWGNIVLLVSSTAFYFLSRIPSVGMMGMALGDTLAAFVMMVYYAARLRTLIDMKSILHEEMPKAVKLSAASVLAGAAIYPAYRFVYVKPHAAIVSIALGVGLIAVFMGIYYLITKMFKLELKR